MERPGDPAESTLTVDVVVERRGDGGRGGALADSRQAEGGEVDFFRERFSLSLPPWATPPAGLRGAELPTGVLTAVELFCCKRKEILIRLSMEISQLMAGFQYI